MAKAIEKGATYLDKLCHKLYDEQKGHGKKSDYVCRICGGPLETYYCEDRLYLVRCDDCGTLALVKTANPGDAARVTLARPTLTPPNEWVSVEDRLPTDERPVLVFVGYADTMTGFITTSSYFCFDANPHWQWDGLVRDEQRTLFWMPLPAPPGKDNNVPTKAPNEPLTWEELMKMEGQPVYIVEIGVRGYWAFVTKAGRFDAHFLTADGDNDYGDEGLYGRTWITYRFLPERQEDT